MTQIKKTIISVFCSAAVFPASVSASESNSLFINEACAKNTVFAAPDGNFYDWIEIYNGSSETADLSGYGLSDDTANPYRFTFPEGTKIEAGGHLLVYCNSKEFTLNGQYTAFFGLSADGETLVLTDKTGKTADTVTFGSIEADVSYGRISDGAADFAVTGMTPGTANKSESVIEKVVVPPSFSVPSGFYSDSFELAISAGEGSKIYFTVDSSTPDKNSNEYTSPFSISNAMNTAREPQRKPEDGKQPGGPDGGQKPPEEQQPGGTASSSDAAVIRAIAYDSEGNASEPVTAVYFIGYQNKASYYQTMKVISIVTDRENLFDRQTGIWQNYDKEGREWERPANMQIFSGGKAELDQNIGIRIHGGYTRRFNQKSLNVYAREEYGKSSIEYDLFSGTVRSEATGKKIKKFDSFILRNAGNDTQDTRFRDKLNQQLVKGRNFLEQGMEPCIVFINGEFYGHYEITEKLSEDYIKSHTDVSKKDVCIVKNQELDEGNEETYQEYREMAEWVKSADLSRSENYEKLCSMVDINSFIDYMSAEIYLANKDWGKNNVALWKSVTVDETNPYADGRWRFILFDTEFSSNIYNTVPANINIFTNLSKDGSFVGNLLTAALKNSEFRQKFTLAFMDTANYNFASDRVNALISEYSSLYRQPASDTMKKFYGNSNFDSCVSTVKSWFGSRYSNAVSQLKDAVGLKGSLVSLTVSNNTASGTVKVGTLIPDFASGTYSGKYYTDYPVTLTAEPAEGNTFKGWKMSDGTIKEGSSVQISLSGNTTVTAVYSGTAGNTDIPAVSGDVNSDGSVNSADLISLISYMCGTSEKDFSKSGDINNDGKVSILDVILLKNKLS